MEEKQLDLNAPLLSIRKSRPTRQQSLPIPKSHWKQPEPKQTEQPEQQLTKPVAVPFTWEQIPGQAKQHKNPQTTKNIPNSDRLPSRATSIHNQSSEDVHDESETLSMSYSCNQSDETTYFEALDPTKNMAVIRGGGGFSYKSHIFRSSRSNIEYGVVRFARSNPVCSRSGFENQENPKKKSVFRPSPATSRKSDGTSELISPSSSFSSFRIPETELRRIIRLPVTDSVDGFVVRR